MRTVLHGTHLRMLSPQLAVQMSLYLFSTLYPLAFHKEVYDEHS
ncbi:hypothetical protein MNBD_CHLOROFLEXI01-1520 [hydrothermal vent metagenome]|uniref:Uncharacterized protein n=1 Tax=hydrothermal vent metagenome TaxID=652676 RepID=A0A3B0VY49_9ZZZZ